MPQVRSEDPSASMSDVLSDALVDAKIEELRRSIDEMYRRIDELVSLKSKID